jgi:uncharacterized protein (TIGR02246 family)
MKNPIKYTWLWIACLAATVLSPAQAQNQQKEVADFAATFQAAYNKGDAAALTKLFAEKVEVTNPDGTTVTRTNGQMGESYAKAFAAYDLKTDIVVGEITALPDGKTRVTGTYATAGTNKTTGEKMTQKGTYDHVAVKENGQWRICHLKLIPEK